MSDKHTPGPWHACAGDDCADLLQDGKRAYFPHVHIGPSDHGRTYPSADGRHYESHSRAITINSTTDGADMAEHDANAHLIAAAPDLLDALLEMASQHRCGCGHPACKNCQRDAMCNDAIAKARGVRS